MFSGSLERKINCYFHHLWLDLTDQISPFGSSRGTALGSIMFCVFSLVQYKTHHLIILPSSISLRICIMLCNAVSVLKLQFSYFLPLPLANRYLSIISHCLGKFLVLHLNGIYCSQFVLLHQDHQAKALPSET